VLHEHVDTRKCSFSVLRYVEVIVEVDFGVCASHRFETSEFALQDGQALNTRKNTLLHLHSHHHMRAIDVVKGVVAQKLVVTEALQKVCVSRDSWPSISPKGV